MISLLNFDSKNRNKEALFLHVLADTFGSIGILIAAYLVKTYKMLWADPACSFFVSLCIIISVIPQLRISLC